MTGKINKGIFKREFVRNNTVVFYEPLQWKRGKNGQFVYADKERRDIEKRLENLGYL